MSNSNALDSCTTIPNSLTKRAARRQRAPRWNLAVWSLVGAATLACMVSYVAPPFLDRLAQDFASLTDDSSQARVAFAYVSEHQTVRAQLGTPVSRRKTTGWEQKLNLSGFQALQSFEVAGPNGSGEAIVKMKVIGMQWKVVKAMLKVGQHAYDLSPESRN